MALHIVSGEVQRQVQKWLLSHLHVRLLERDRRAARKPANFSDREVRIDGKIFAGGLTTLRRGAENGNARTRTDLIGE